MSDFKTSIDEYTKEEIDKNGNGVYGGKRHDEICDYLQECFSFDEFEINDISMGVWKGIESEKMVSDIKMKSLQSQLATERQQNKELIELLESIYNHENDMMKISDGKGASLSTILKLKKTLDSLTCPCQCSGLGQGP